MKNFIKQKLQESLMTELTKGGSYTVYHGSKTQITNFVDEFVGGDNAIDQEGPGIYFTTSKEEAETYGEYLYTVTLTPRQLMDETPSNPRKLTPFITKMVRMAPEWKDKAQNYDENPLRGLNIFVESTLDYNDTEKDVAQQIWVEFYRYQPVDYVRNMVKMGIDGIKVKREYNDITHFIIYNPSIITVLK